MTQSHIVKVSGIPARRYEEDLLLDKLLLHFLQRRNGGNGEVEVRYPTEEEGVAMLTFDLVEVAEQVLTRRHQLEIQGHTYPLKVSRLQLRGTQFFMPVTASLNIVYFDDTSEVRRILKKHNLKVCSEDPFCLHVEGDFQDLNRCRDELYKTLSNLSLSRRPHSENRMSRRDKYYTLESSPENNHVSREEAHVKKLNAQQSQGNNVRHKSSERNPSPRRTLKSLPPDIDRCSSTVDKKKTPSIKQPLTQINRPINSSAGSSQRKAKERSSDDSPTSTTNQPRSKMAANLNFHPVPPNKTSVDENRRVESSSPLVSSRRAADGSGLGSHMAFTSPQIGENLPESGQAKGTTRDEFISSPKHHTSTRDSSYLNPGQPNNVSVDELNSNPKHPKSPTNSNSGKLQNPRNPVTSSASSSPSSSLMAAGRSSSKSPTVNSSTAMNYKSHLDQSTLSTEIFVDRAVQTYISVFLKDTISDVMGQSVEMKTETCEGYNRVILTAKSPDHSQVFYKATRDISDIFMKCQSSLRVERINLSNMSTDATRKLQRYLCSCDIMSFELPKKMELEMIGPSKNILAFMEKWISARGDFEIFLIFTNREISAGSSRPPVVGKDNVSTTHNYNDTREGQTPKPKLRERSEESNARGESRRPDTKNRSNTPNRPWR